MDPPFEAPDVPTRFPCWCRAIYSWGGEHKRDLGFVEGDLIECLNSGDGSWWMGRLRRNMKVKGMFPSNFVIVLDEDFRPASRASSALSSRSPSPNPFNPQPPQSSKSKPFRKPFQAYAAPDPGAQKRAEIRKQETISIPRTPSPPQRNRNQRRQSPPRFNGYSGSRAPSPNPYATRMGAPSPEFPPSRAESPSSTFNYEAEHGSPPPPPPHRTNFRAQTSTGFREDRDLYSHDFHKPRSLTPDSHTPERTGHTPSPLTHAMNDVISSLEDMGIPEHSAQSQHGGTKQDNFDPWSPEEFDQGYAATPTRLNTPLRPNTSSGVDREYDHSKNRPNHRRSRTDFSEEPPVLSNYVERMESRLGRVRRGDTPRSSQGSEDVMAPPEVPPKTGFFRSKSPFGRPKSPFGRPKSPFGRPKSPFTRSTTPSMPPPPIPNHPRAKSSMGDRGPPPVLRHKKSAFEVGKAIIGRTFTTKSASTNGSSGQQSTTTNGTVSTQATGRSLMSGQSAGAFSATSAGEYAQKQAEKYGRARSALGVRTDELFSRKNGGHPEFDGSRPETPFTGVTYHSSHATEEQTRSKSQAGWRSEVPVPDLPGLGGLVTPKPKKSGFFKRMVESAKTGAASARSNIAVGEFVKPNAPLKSAMPKGVTAVAGGFGNSVGNQYANAKDTAKDMGLGGGTGIDWVQVRRDVNRSNSLSRHERAERRERCEMMDLPAIEPVRALGIATDGDQAGDGHSVLEPTDFQSASLSLVDKNARFVNSLPPSTNPVSLATGFVCRPYKNDVQRLRAIFTWCAEKILWEDDFEGDVDTSRVVQTRRGGTEELVFLVLEMCQAVNIPCNVIRGYLKTPGEAHENGRVPHPNHFWNSVLVDDQWRIMDCSLASPSHPKRCLFSNASNDKAESWYFLTRPIEICWTHVPELPSDQHLIPPVDHGILLALPSACPPFFKNGLEMVGYDTSITRIEDLELVHIKISVPADIECAAEVEALSLSQDQDGDFYETDNIARLHALCQPSWTGGQKQYTIKALLPPNAGSQGILKIYAGKRGLMHGTTIPHPLAVALPIVHQGEGFDYEFFTHYPTPHASRHDIYLMQPQCKRLVVGNTFVFTARQHPSGLQLTEAAVSEASGNNRDGGRSPVPGLGSRDGNRSPLPFIRPTSALSMTNSTSASGAASGSGSTPAFKQFKHAKLAIQTPSGKILRLLRKDVRMGTARAGEDGGFDAPPDGNVYETIIKCGEKGMWRGLVLADRSARWCIFAEWNCV